MVLSSIYFSWQIHTPGPPALSAWVSAFSRLLNQGPEGDLLSASKVWSLSFFSPIPLFLVDLWNLSSLCHLVASIVEVNISIQNTSSTRCLQNDLLKKKQLYWDVIYITYNLLISSVQFSGFYYIHRVVQLSPQSNFRIFPHPLKKSTPLSYPL